MASPPSAPDPTKPLNARGEERPTFVLEFPDDPALTPLVEAFEYGNYAKVRQEAPALAQNTADPRVRRAAEELLRRIEPDPLVKQLLLVAVCLFLFVAGWVYLKAAR
jgi:hypothetical protein